MRFHSSGGSARRASPQRRRRAPLVRRVGAEAHPDRVRAERLGAEVRGEHHHRVGEVDVPALAVGQPALLEHLEQQHQHVAVRLLHLVQQDHRRSGAGAPARSAGRRRRSPRSPAGAPMSREVACDSDSSLMSSRISASRLPKSTSASARASSVLPTPGGAEEEEAAHAAGGWRSRRSCGGSPAPPAPRPPRARSPACPAPPPAAAAAPSRSSAAAPRAARRAWPPPRATSARLHPVLSLAAARASRPGPSREIALSGSEPVAHVARGQRRGGLERRRRVAQPVVLLVAADAARRGSPRSPATDRLAAPPPAVKRRSSAGSAWMKLAELVVGGGADAGELAARHRALQLVGRVLRALAGGARADQGVDLVDEDHHATRRRAAPRP